MAAEFEVTRTAMNQWPWYDSASTEALWPRKAPPRLSPAKHRELRAIHFDRH